MAPQHHRNQSLQSLLALLVQLLPLVLVPLLQIVLSQLIGITPLLFLPIGLVLSLLCQLLLLLVNTPLFAPLMDQWPLITC